MCDWDRVNAIRHHVEHDGKEVWIVQTFDYYVLYNYLTEKEADEKVAEINSMPLTERRKRIADLKVSARAMSDNPLYAELDRLRTELAANKRVAARLEEQRAKAEERVREMEASCAVMRRALEAVSQELCEWPMPEPAHEGPCGPETLCDGDCMSRYNVFRHNQSVRQVKDALTTDTGKAILERMVKQEKALRAWRAWCLDERHSVADDTQLFEAAIELMDDALDTKEAQDTTNMCPKCGKALMGKPLGCVIHGLVDPIEEAPDA